MQPYHSTRKCSFILMRLLEGHERLPIGRKFKENTAALSHPLDSGPWSANSHLKSEESVNACENDGEASPCGDDEIISAQLLQLSDGSFITGEEVSSACFTSANEEKSPQSSEDKKLFLGKGSTSGSQTDAKGCLMNQDDMPKLLELVVSSEEVDADTSYGVTYKKQIVKQDGTVVNLYTQKFRQKWLLLPEFRGWLASSSDPTKAVCKVCCKELIAGKSELMRHAKSKKHITAMAICLPYPLSSSAEFRESGNLSRVVVDLRSDTVTVPCADMLEAMCSSLAEDACEEGTAMKSLESKVAKYLGKEAAVFLPSGTMANLVAVFTHCWERDWEVILGDESFLYRECLSSIVQLGGIPYKVVKTAENGTLCLVTIESLLAKKGLNAGCTLVCIENTHSWKGGTALPIQWLNELSTFAIKHRLKIHMDGARLINAAVALGQTPSVLASYAHSVTLCLNKGLGAPMGSMLAGSMEFIERARHIRQLVGGSNCGGSMFAAAGTFAVEHNAPCLYLDHQNARAVAQGVTSLNSEYVFVRLDSVQTNIVHLHTDGIRITAHCLCDRLSRVTEEEEDVLGSHVIIKSTLVDSTTVRFVLHKDVKREAVSAAVEKLKYSILNISEF